MRHPLFLLTLALAPTFTAHAAGRDLHVPTQAVLASEARVALVIGNGAYTTGSLRNPPNDAKAVAARLRELGFDVTLRTDLGYQGLNMALIDFGQQLKAGGVGLFYYAGHGIQSGGHNYLVPVDAKITGEAYIRAQAVDVDLVLAGMAEAHNRVNLVILDACRNNPFERSFRSGGQGLGVPTNTPRGTLIAYATGPGSVAEDGEGANSSYTRALVETLGSPGLKVEEVFKSVRLRVEQATGGRQTPWETSSLTGDFYFKTGSSTHSGPSLPVKGSGSAGSDVDVSRPTASAAYELRVGGVEYTMVPIPAGSFTMGSPASEEGRDADETQHQVRLSRSYWIGETEVTQGLWKAVMGSNPSYFSSCGANCPVEQVSWCDAVLFANDVSRREGLAPVYAVPSGFVVGMDRDTCNSKSGLVRWDASLGGYRLPTEAEWEHAARGGQGYVYAGSGRLDDVAWYNKNSGSKSHAVGGKQANGQGLFDMSGNVWEWTWDGYGGYPKVTLLDPKGPVKYSFRIIRGGSWDYDARDTRISNRNGFDPGNSGSSLGFRLSRSGH